MCAERCSIVRRLGRERAGTIDFARFLANDAVTAKDIFSAAAEQTGRKAAGRHVLAIQDTTALSFPQRRRHPGGLGPGGDGVVPGLFLHPVLAIDAEGDACFGLAAGRVWTRPPEKTANRKRRPLGEKESARWLEEGLAARRALVEAAHVTFLGDRDRDIYACWARLPGEGCDMLARASRNRRLAGGGLLFDVADGWTEADRITPYAQGAPSGAGLAVWRGFDLSPERRARH